MLISAATTISVLLTGAERAIEEPAGLGGARAKSARPNTNAALPSSARPKQHNARHDCMQDLCADQCGRERTLDEAEDDAGDAERRDEQARPLPRSPLVRHERETGSPAPVRQPRWRDRLQRRALVDRPYQVVHGVATAAEQPNDDETNERAGPARLCG